MASSSMSTARRLLSTSAPRALQISVRPPASTGVSPATSSTSSAPAIIPDSIPSTDLPDSLQTIIRNHMRRHPPTEPASIPNPFIDHVRAREVDPDNDNPFAPPTELIRPIIRKRTQKLLKERYSPLVLPPSPINDITAPPVILYHGQGPDDSRHRGTEVRWVGDFEVKPKIGLYATKKARFREGMFKMHKRERIAPIRKAQIDERLEGMPERVEAWRQKRREDSNKNLPSLPF